MKFRTVEFSKRRQQIYKAATKAFDYCNRYIREVGLNESVKFTLKVSTETHEILHPMSAIRSMKVVGEATARTIRLDLHNRNEFLPYESFEISFMDDQFIVVPFGYGEPTIVLKRAV